MTLSKLRQEYAETGLGPIGYSIVRDVVSATVRRYPPTIYAAAASWDDAQEDVIQEFTLTVLLEQGQLEYALTVSKDGEHFRRLLVRQLQFFLAKSRRRTVVDNLLERSKALVSEGPFELESARGTWRFRLAGGANPGSPLTESQLAQLSAELAAIPLSAADATERLPQCYSTVNLQVLLTRAARATASWLSNRDLSRIFERLLTPWLIGRLYSIEGGLDPAGSQDLSPEDLVVIKDAVAMAVSLLSATERSVLLWKLSDVSDGDIGRRLGVSRPTAMKLKRAAFSKLEPLLSGFSSSAKTRMLADLGPRLLELETRVPEDL